ncbi:MAG: type II secretion system protein [Campylobacterales bacterium]|jgi:prepilin-type N-terminal cleavage/methylation domain-containing protein
MNKKAFTLIELIFVIVIIGVLASVAIPKFSGLSDNSKVAAELSTASSVQTAIDACHGEWIINEGSFTCGKSISQDDLTDAGYPKDGTLGDSDDNPLNKILKNTTSDVWSVSNTNEFRGPASNDDKNPVKCKDEKPHKKPCEETHWLYNKDDGTFTLTDDD